MKRLYLDNAATTPLLPQVIDSMVEVLKTTYGNPSSTHAFGRSAKALVEQSRKKIAQSLHCHTSELVFTSGGTEANNLILKNAVTHLGIQHIVTSVIEHHAVLHTLDYLRTKNVKISYVSVLENGEIDLNHLETLIASTSKKTLISLMHVNNEIGTILNLKKVVALKNKYENVLFHSDTVQSIGHFELNLEKIEIDFLTASAHKFHGPKGIGFAYFKKGTAIQPEILGGEQERGTRAGTENTAAIVGMSTALELCISTLKEDIEHLKSLKSYLIHQLKQQLPLIVCNGNSDNLEKSTHTILNIQFPKEFPMLLFQLDLKGIAVSGGSACQSGSHKGSHVLQSFLDEKAQQNTSVRISLSKLTKQEDLNLFLKELTTIIS